MLPWYLDLLSRLAPLRYAVDPTCGVSYAGSPEVARVVLAPVAVNLLAVGGMFAACLVVGTGLFVRGERNRSTRLLGRGSELGGEARTGQHGADQTVPHLDRAAQRRASNRHSRCPNQPS